MTTQLECERLDLDASVSHINLDLPVMPPDHQFKRWKAAFLIFVRMKLPTLIPQMVTHKSRPVIHTKARHDIIQIMLLHCAGGNRRAREALDMVNAS